MPTSPFLSDEDLLVKNAQKNPEAFAELYRRYVQRVYRYHIIRTGSVEDAQDLTTQTFLTALERLHSFQGRGSFCAWLLGIARHKLALHFRSRRPLTRLEEADDRLDPAPLPETITGQRSQMAQVSQALSRLTPDRMEALALRYFADLSTAETGKVMGKSEAAVKMLVSRGLHDLRERLGLAMQEDFA